MREKVALRALEPEDLDMLYKIENDRQLWNVGTTNVPYSRYMLHDYIAHANNDIYVDKQVRLMIVNESGERVGIVDVVDFNPQHMRAEIGIAIVENYRGRGYGLAAIGQMLDYCRRVLHLHQIYAIVDKNNVMSVNLFKSCGFDHITELPDWLFDGDEYRTALLMQSFL